MFDQIAEHADYLLIAVAAILIYRWLGHPLAGKI
jgi:hypothetical protein